MTGADWTESRPARLALAAVVLSALLTLWALARALRVDDPSTVPPAAGALAPPPPRPPAPPVRVHAVVERDPFAPDRAAPLARYRMPHEEDVEEPVEEVAPPVQPQVLGTVVATRGRSFAICQLQDSPPTVVRVGDKVGEFTVREIARGRVTFTTAAGGRVVVSAPSTAR
jgi:hypothetical protein